LDDIVVPLYDSAGAVDDRTLRVGELGGRIVLVVTDAVPGVDIRVECYFGDLHRAWRAVDPEQRPRTRRS
jgi:hypothetical protein